MCAFPVFRHGSAQVGTVFFVYLLCLVAKSLLSKHKICVMLKLSPNIPVVLKNICVVKISLYQAWP